VNPLGRFGAWVGQWGIRPVAEMLYGARVLEETGYQTLWYGEAMGREAFAAGALLLGGTESVTVATGVANIWARDATAMLNGGRTLAEAYPGRFVLGIGVSHGPLVDRRGHRYDTPLKTMAEYIDQMESARSYVDSPAGEPPLLLGALGPRMLCLAAERCAGAHPYLVPVEHTRRARRLMGPDAWLAPEQAAVVATDPEVARSVARDHVKTHVSFPNYRNALIRLGWPEQSIDALTDELVDALVAWGDPGRVAARMTDHLEAGADHVAIHLLATDGATVPVEDYLALAPALEIA
jgi:probable F420-dependent oxidoreductase